MTEGQKVSTAILFLFALMERIKKAFFLNLGDEGRKASQDEYN